jgi:hypothetical protein
MQQGGGGNTGGGGNSLRNAIATVVKLLAHVGVCGLTPETLRQCKFDSPKPVVGRPALTLTLTADLLVGPAAKTSLVPN